MRAHFARAPTAEDECWLTPVVSGSTG